MPARRRPVARLLASWVAVLVALGLGVATRVGSVDPGPLTEVTAAGPAAGGAATSWLTVPLDATTTTAAPTTTTTAPPPPPDTTTTAPPPPPAPTTTEAPAPPPPPPPPAPVDPGPAVSATPAYARSLLEGVIPARWLAVLPVTIEVIVGKTSWSSFSGLIEIGDWHLTSSVDRARNVLAHEWGHQVAWHYGTDAYNGAPPAGFPYSGRLGEEMWADCVATALTGTSYPSHGLPGCPGDALSFTSAFLAAGPGPRLR